MRKINKADMSEAFIPEHDFITGVFSGLVNSPNDMLPSEWAERNRFLTSGSTPFPGKFHWKRTPFWREVVDIFSPLNPTQKVAVMKSTQIGCTCAVYENVIGYTMSENPQNVLFVSGDQKMIDTVKKTRIDPMIQKSGLADKISPMAVSGRGGKRTGDAKGILEYSGGFTYFCGANNESNFQSQSFSVILQDETDLYPHKVGKSGDTVSLVDARADAFTFKKIGYMSRPTVDYGGSDPESGETTNRGSKILELYLHGDQNKYMVPAPCCGAKQELVFYSRSGGFKDGDYGLKFDSKACKDGDYSSVGYRCKHCGEVFKEHHKPNIIQPEAGAEWIPTSKAKEPWYKSYHISALYSLTVEWWTIVNEFLKSKGDPLKMQLFYNRFLGLPFDDRQGGVEVTQVRDKVGEYHSGQIPKGALFLTAAADVQTGKNARVEIEVKAWGRDFANWSIDYRVFKGDVTDVNSDCWKKVGAMLDEHWSCDGVDMQIERILVDSSDGNVTSIIYDVCEMYGTQQVLILPVKGMPVTASTRKYYQAMDLKNRAFPLIEVFSDNYKNRISAWINQQWRHGEEAPPGWTQFPDNYPASYFRMLVSEKKEKKRIGQRTIVSWVAHGRNEAFDTFVYNCAAAEYVIENYSISCLGLENIDPNAVWEYFEEKFDTD